MTVREKSGKLELSAREIETVSERGGEIGATHGAFREMTAMLREQAKALKTVSNGDYTPALTLKELVAK